MIIPLALAGLTSAGTMSFFANKEKKHTARMESLDYNIHVNGIRGKSTITRMLGGVLRHAGVNTIVKTTGTYACVIASDASEHPIQRKGPANINEQYQFLEEWLTPETKGLVVECMAVKPKYQNMCQHQILRSPLTVITNVRIDHQDEMGDTLEEIAVSLCNTIPQNGTVITGERNPEIVKVMEREAEKYNARIIVAPRTELSASLVDKFSYHQFEENVAVALTVAEFLGLDIDAAITGMISAEPDPGTVQITELKRDQGNSVYWANMLAINDWESTTKVYRDLSEEKMGEDTRRVIALNNRKDRTDRAMMFVNLVAEDLAGEFDRIVLYGDLQDAVEKSLVDRGIDESLIQTTEEIEDEDGRALLNCATEGFEGEDVAVFGMVNIHTVPVTSVRRHVSALVEGQREYAAVGA